jgi:hypothetical protein
VNKQGGGLGLVRERCGGDSPGGEAERQGRRSGRGEAVGRSARSVVAWRGGGGGGGAGAQVGGIRASTIRGGGRRPRLHIWLWAGGRKGQEHDEAGGVEDAVGALGRRMPFVAWHARRLRGIYRHVTFR